MKKVITIAIFVICATLSVLADVPAKQQSSMSYLLEAISWGRVKA